MNNIYIENLIGVLTRTSFDPQSAESVDKWDRLKKIWEKDPGYFSSDPRRVSGLECWPFEADSMIGVYRMKNIYESLKWAIDKGIEGDFVETGVWKGGACILANAVLHEFGEQDKRRVHVFDSFEGLPRPYMEEDNGDPHHTLKFLAVSLETVMKIFDEYGYLTDNVRFRKGFFKDTMPNTWDIESISVLRLDGDMYSSTIEVLEALYDKVSPGGTIIIDDWTLKGARSATIDFRNKRGITSEIVPIDEASMYWRK